MQRPILLATCALFFVCNFALGQTTDSIHLVNPSFEGMPTLSRSPDDWMDCGFFTESAPDVHPVENSPFQVTQQAFDGYTYLGMVVRDNNTWEAVSQYLRQPLEAEKKYEFSINMARSQAYLSLSRLTNEAANYATPTVLRIWAGNNPCEKLELLAASKAVINTEWLEYTFRFQTREEYRYILLEAHYADEALVLYNGNLLLDNCSPIVMLADSTQFDVQKQPKSKDQPFLRQMSSVTVIGETKLFKTNQTDEEIEKISNEILAEKILAYLNANEANPLVSDEGVAKNLYYVNQLKLRIKQTGFKSFFKYSHKNTVQKTLTALSMIDENDELSVLKSTLDFAIDADKIELDHILKQNKKACKKLLIDGTLDNIMDKYIAANREEFIDIYKFYRYWFATPSSHEVLLPNPNQ